MMIDVLPEVVKALRANPDLIRYLGGEKRVYQLRAPRDTPFPYVTLFEVTNVSGRFADNKEFAASALIQIDIWHDRDDTFNIADQVNCTMTALQYRREGGASLYESDTCIYHRALRFSTTRLVEGD